MEKGQGLPHTRRKVLTVEPYKPSRITNERIRILVKERLNQKGITIGSIDHITNIEGDPENHEFRDMPIWHTKQDVEHAVVRQLGLNERSDTGSSNVRQIYTAVASAILEIRQSGDLRDWNSRMQTGVWRLERLPSGDMESSGSGASDFVVIVGKKDEERFRIFAIGEDRARIKNIETLRGAERVWALLSKRTPDATWSRVRRGDQVFFARYGMPFSHLGTVAGTLADRSLAIRLWGDAPKVRQLDRLVLFSSVQEISKQFSETCRLAGVRPNPYTAIYVAKNRISTPVESDRHLLDSKLAGVVILKGETEDIVELEADTAGPPNRVTEAVTRFLRDTEKVRQLKSKYRGKCQICGYVLRREDDYTYSEVHHLHPLKDAGDDNFENMLNLCAKHHVEFDYLVIGISEDHKTIVGRRGDRVGTITFSLDHKLAHKNVLFHLRRMGIR